MLKHKRVEAHLATFGNNVIAKAKQNLRKRNASSGLSKSLEYDLKISLRSFEFSISMETYGKFLDKGVSGVKRKHNTPYSYRSKGGKRGLKGMPPPKAFDKWNIRRGIAPRNSKGQFGSRKQTNFLIAKSIFEKGIKPTNFLTKPFEDEFKHLPDQLVEKYALDVEEFLTFILK